MGIPSFYRHLCRKYPRLIARGSGPRPSWFCLDFNCAMYHVLRRFSAENPFAAASSPRAWEDKFCAAIADYLDELIGLAKPTEGVYVSCDGVVCAAKRKQQRLRRFKGPWMAAQEAALRPAVETPATNSWDQNALTPGSDFMARLNACLTAAAPRLQSRHGVSVAVSTTHEPGEGEHKLLRRMREVRPTSCTIYGLDADLILLSLLLRADTGADIRLLREAQEFESNGAHDEWRTLTVTGLADVMLPRGPAYVRDFVAAMSLLGNDFLPRSLTKTVRDQGIPLLIATLQRAVWSHGTWLVNDAAHIHREALLSIMREWAGTEETDMYVAAADARRRSRVGGGDALQAWSSLPAQWATLTRILHADGTRLIADWRRVVREDWRAGDAHEYLQGIAWVWDYYQGRTVDQGWYYAAHLPPLWSDIVTILEQEKGATLHPPPVTYPTHLPEWLHLLSVLPVDSVRRLVPADKHTLMDKATHFWPAAWSLFDVGRTQMWECEPVIPVIPERVLRSWGNEVTATK